MDPENFLIWNVRGLNSSVRQDSIKELVDSSQVDVVCFQETKMQNITRRNILSMLGADFPDYVYLPSVGASGGILIAWRRHIGHTEQRKLHNHSVSVQFCKAGGQAWWLTCVYGPQGEGEKIQFLQELRDIRNACDGTWMVAGDFNLIYCSVDKNNSNINRVMMGRFRQTINDLALKEIPLHGRKYTWSNQQANPVLVKLDRVFCSVSWEQRFPNVLLQSMASHASDHCPLLLGLKGNKPGKKRFHFEAFWPKLEGFLEVVQAAWDSVQNIRCPFQTLDMKLGVTARYLQSWSDKQVGHVRLQLALAKELLHRLEMAQDERALSPAENWFKNRLKSTHCCCLLSNALWQG
jgi:exonuclease III